MALLQVKEELGSEAVIMSNKKVAGGVEIVAAVDGDFPPVESPVPAVKTSRTSKNPYMDMAEDTVEPRQLKDDRVSLNAFNGEQASGMTPRFANMLKHYSNEKSGDAPLQEDSLAALLRRQQEKSSDGTLSPMLKEGSPLARLLAEEEPEPQRLSPRLDPTRYERPTSKERAAEKVELEEMRDELSSIRRLLEHQVSGLLWQEVERREPLRAMLIKRLENMGISTELADQLACYIPEDVEPNKAWRALLALVADQIPVAKQDILKTGGVVALLGPTGVGKTTTVAKLAARAAMEYGADNVALVTTDMYRIGAHEQLLIYGRIMGCPVRVAKDSNELADVIYQLRNRRLILVDTAGMGQRDVRLSEQLDTLMQNSGKVINSYLVLPATAQRKVLQETIDHFRRIPLSGCIMTKLDESLSLGEFVSVVVQNALPVVYIANGQRVPEDIVLAQPKYMVAKANELLEKSSENTPHFWNSSTEGL